MIVLVLIAICALVVRLWRRQVTRGEVALAAVVFGNVLLVWGQEVFGPGKPFPEWRYYMQSSLLLYGFGVWAILALPDLRLGRRKLSTARLLSGVFLLFVVYDVVMLCKAHFPIGRRAAYVAACDWARVRISADWKGPSADKGNPFNAHEYHTPYRPVVQAHTARLPYLLGGRDSSLTDFPEVDIPDYWFSDINRDNPPAVGYDEIGTFVRGKYTFRLLRKK